MAIIKIRDFSAKYGIKYHIVYQRIRKLDIQPARSIVKKNYTIFEYDEETIKKVMSMYEKNVEGMLSIKQASDKFSLSETYICQLIHKFGLNPARKVGRLKMFDEVEMENLLINKEVKIDKINAERQKFYLRK